MASRGSVGKLTVRTVVELRNDRMNQASKIYTESSLRHAGVTVRVITNMHISDYFSSILGVRKS
jgi:hypothetical protein